MARVVVTVEALRCWQCQKLMHPTEPFVRRQMLTAVETGSRMGTVQRYERVNVCTDCHAFFEKVEAEERISRRWYTFWFWSVIVAFIGAFFTPYSMPTLYGAIIVRLIWKWQAKRRQKSTLGQPDRRKVPPTNAPSDVATGLTKGESA